MKIAFHGKRGSYAEAAAAWMFADQDIATQPMATPQAAIDAVVDGNCQFAVLRIENSESGISQEVLTLLRVTRLYFARDIRFHERYNLAGQRDASLAAVKRIYGNPMLLSICGDFLGRLEGVRLIASYDSAEMLAQLIQRGDSSEATVCSDFAADIYGLKRIQSEIENTADSSTRFVAVCAEKSCPPAATSGVSTALLFELKHQPGALIDALSAFREHGINLTTVFARPARGSKWDYATYIEFAGRYDDDAARAALAELRQHTTYMQLLGSFDTVQPQVPTA